MAHGRGKQLFREVSKTVTQLKRDIASAERTGNFYTYGEFMEWTLQIMEEFENTLSDSGLDVEFWSERLSEKIGNLQTELETKRLLMSDDEREDEEDWDSDFEDGNETFETILGYDVISEGECGAREGRVRGQILTTLEELAEYLEPIPAGVVRGLVPVEGKDGERVGYSVCAATKSR